MKKVVLLMLFAVCSLTAQAQFHLGLEGGMNISNPSVDWDQIDNSSGTVGYYIGIMPKFKLSESIHINADIQYSLKGFSGEQSASDLDIKTRYHYLDIIPQLEFLLGESFGLFVGPDFSFKLKVDTKIGDEGWEEIDDFDLIKGSDFGATFGGRVYLGKLYLNVSYTLGLVNVGEEEDVEIKNRNLQLGGGLMF